MNQYLALQFFATLHRPLPVRIDPDTYKFPSQTLPNRVGVRASEEEVISCFISLHITHNLESFPIVSSDRQVMKEYLGTPCGNQTTLLHSTLFLFYLTCSHFLTAEKTALKSSSPCFHITISSPFSGLGGSIAIIQSYNS